MAGTDMRFRNPTKLSDILSSSSLSRIHQSNELRKSHETVWQNQIDSTIRSSCRLHQLREGTLTIAADHQTVASQLRYLSRIIVQQLQCHAEFRNLQRLRIIVRPALPAPKRQANNLPRLSAATAKHLKDVADSLGNSELSGRLRALARHAEGGRK